MLVLLYNVFAPADTVSVAPASVTNEHSNPDGSPVGIVSVADAVNMIINPLSAVDNV